MLFVGAMGRSGSTLLDLMLGAVPGAFSAGELRYLWEKGPAQNLLCGCGARFRDCPFWSEVGEQAFGGWDSREAQSMIEIDPEIDRHRHLTEIITGRGRRRTLDLVDHYRSMLERLYEAIRHVSGCDVIIDSTKDPPYAFLLRGVRGVDLRLVHLVRDCRGVAYSWTKLVTRPEVPGETAYMDRVQPAMMALKWLDYNALFHAMGAMGTPRVFVQYESLVRDPRRHVGRIAAHAGLALGDSDALPTDGAFTPPEHHTISGNPVRFERGPLRLRVDEEWRTRMPRRDRLAVETVAWPLLAAYGYIPDGRAGG